MGIYIDIFLVAIVIVFLVVSAKRGFMITILEVAAFALAIILSAELCKPVASSVYKLIFEPTVVKKITETLPDNATTATTAKKASAVLDNLPDFAKNYIKSTSSGSDDITQKIMSGTYSGENVAKQLNEDIAKPMSVSILSSIMFILLGIILLLIFKSFAKGLNKLFKLPIVGAANGILGGAFGILKGLVVVYFLSILLLLIAVRTGESTSLYKAVNDSSIITFVQSFNTVQILK